MKKRLFILTILFLSFALFSAQSTRAYETNMPASVVLGQTDFTSNSTGTTKGKFSNVIRGIFVDNQGRLIVADQNNNRVFVWNTIPTTNGAEPDLVLGQADFTSVLANRGGSVAANTLSGPSAAYSDGTKLYILDRNNDRVLIWSTFPTQNGQAATIAVGASDLVTNPTDACNASTLSDPYGMTVYGTKLLVADRTQNRILIWETIPLSSGAAATKVIGQPDLITCSAQVISDKSLSDPRGISTDSEGRLIVADRGRQRVLIWSSIPSTNFASANLVVGQPDFVSSGVGVSNSRIGSILAAYSNGTQLFIADINRILIFNQFPTTNGASATVVLGQVDFSTNSANAGGTTTANSLNASLYVHERNNILFVIDESNARVLLFYNPPVPVAPADAFSTNYSSSNSTTCSDFAPVGNPDLFQILRIKNSAVVFFTPVLNSTRTYLVMYGFKEGEEQYGASSESLTAESNLGVQKLAISDLDPNQEYWFKVAPKNGCATGEWSNWMKAPQWQGKPKLVYK